VLPDYELHIIVVMQNAMTERSSEGFGFRRFLGARAITDFKWGVSAGRLELMLPCLRSTIISDKLLRLLPGLCDSSMCGGSRAIGKAIDEAYSQSPWHSA
jgi:hypothetical protein